MPGEAGNVTSKEPVVLPPTAPDHTVHQFGAPRPLSPIQSLTGRPEGAVQLTRTIRPPRDCNETEIPATGLTVTMAEAEIDGSETEVAFTVTDWEPARVFGAE